MAQSKWNGWILALAAILAPAVMSARASAAQQASSARVDADEAALSCIAGRCTTDDVCIARCGPGAHCDIFRGCRL